MATLCDSSHVKAYAGTNVSTALTPAQYTLFINGAEGQLIADTGVNWIDAYTAATPMNNDFSGLLTAATAAFAAVKAVKFDPGSYNPGEAMNIINTNLTEYDRAVVRLKDQNVYKPFGVSKMEQ